MSQQISVPMPGHGQIRVQLGDIAVTDTQVHTPGGSYPLAGTVWGVNNQTHTVEVIPGCAIVLAVFCLLGLLFLAIKEPRTHGSVQVTVQGPGFFHGTPTPMRNEAAVYHISNQVNWIRGRVGLLPA